MVLKNGTRLAELQKYLRKSFQVSLNLREGRQISTACLRKEKFRKTLSVDEGTTVGEVRSFVSIFNLSIDLLSPHGEVLPISLQLKDASEYVNIRKEKGQFSRQLEVVESLLNSTAYDDADLLMKALEKAGRLIENDEQTAYFLKVLGKVENAKIPVTGSQIENLKSMLRITE